jgi:hypothetical protein
MLFVESAKASASSPFRGLDVPREGVSAMLLQESGLDREAYMSEASQGTDACLPSARITEH